MAKGVFKCLPAYFTPFLALGLAAGFTNGLLGAGGGIILILALPKLSKKHSFTSISNMENKDWYASALGVMLPATVVSSAVYFVNGGIADKRALLLLSVPAAAGGVIGALLLGRINAKWLKRLFAILVIVSGIRMIMK